MVSSDRGLILRRFVLFSSLVLLAIGLYWVSRAFVVDGQLRFGNPVPEDEVEGVGGEGAEPQEPRQIRAEITRVEGNPGVRLGDKCEFLVERRMRDPQSYYCNAQVVCGGRLIYGGPDRGYFACRLSEGERRDVIGSDPSTTSADQDAAIQLDTRAGVLRIWDDGKGPLGAFTVEADVLSVR